MHPTSIYLGLKVVRFKYFRTKVYTIWVHRPLSCWSWELMCFLQEIPDPPKEIPGLLGKTELVKVL